MWILDRQNRPPPCPPFRGDAAAGTKLWAVVIVRCLARRVGRRARAQTKKLGTIPSRLPGSSRLELFFAKNKHFCPCYVQTPAHYISPIFSLPLLTRSRPVQQARATP